MLFHVGGSRVVLYNYVLEQLKQKSDGSMRRAIRRAMTFGVGPQPRRPRNATVECPRRNRETNRRSRIKCRVEYQLRH